MTDKASPLDRLCDTKKKPAFCVADVTLSALQARSAWQTWYFRYLHRCQRKLGDEEGYI